MPAGSHCFPLCISFSPHLQNPSPLELRVSHIKPACGFLNAAPAVQIAEQSLPNASSWQEMQLPTGCKNPFLEKQTRVLGNRLWGAHLVSAHSYCPCQHPVWPAINFALHLWFRTTPYPSSQFSRFLSSVFCIWYWSRARVQARPLNCTPSSVKSATSFLHSVWASLHTGAPNCHTLILSSSEISSLTKSIPCK